MPAIRSMNSYANTYLKHILSQLNPICTFTNLHPNKKAFGTVEADLHPFMPSVIDRRQLWERRFGHFIPFILHLVQQF